MSACVYDFSMCAGEVGGSDGGDWEDDGEEEEVIGGDMEEDTEETPMDQEGGGEEVSSLHFASIRLVCILTRIHTHAHCAHKIGRAHV